MGQSDWDCILLSHKNQASCNLLGYNANMGILIVLLSVVCYAILPVLVKKANQNIPPFTIMTISMFVLFTASLILSLIFENGKIWKSFDDSKNLVLILVAMGLINTLGFWLVIQAFKYMPLWQQTMFNLLAPALTGIFAYFILGEAISIKLFLGLLIMGVGLYIAVR